MTDHPTTPPSSPPTADPATVRAMLNLLGIAVAEDDPRLPVLVTEFEGQLAFARLIDEVLVDVPAEAVAGAVGTYDPTWHGHERDAEVAS